MIVGSRMSTFGAAMIFSTFGGAPTMPRLPADQGSTSGYLSVPLRTLYDACRAAGRDDSGKACATCPVNYICAAERIRRD
jgi:hypothetical protein